MMYSTSTSCQTVVFKLQRLRALLQEQHVALMVLLVLASSQYRVLAGQGYMKQMKTSASGLVILALALAGQSAAAWARQRLQHVEKERMAGFRYWLH